MQTETKIANMLSVVVFDQTWFFTKTLRSFQIQAPNRSVRNEWIEVIVNSYHMKFRSYREEFAK